MATNNIITTKCPILNMEFRDTTLNGSPDLEVLVEIDASPISTKPIGLICPEYQGNGVCGSNEGGCIYSQGFRRL